MKKIRFTETQIVNALKEHEGGRSAEDICRKMDISKRTLYNWKSKYGGMEASDVKRLTGLVAGGTAVLADPLLPPYYSRSLAPTTSGRFCPFIRVGE